MTLPWPDHGRLVGVDYGTVRIGLAICDPERIIASPYETYHRRTPALDAAYFERLVREERVVGFVVGLPVHLSGDESQKSLEVRRFAAWLTQGAALPVRFVDERFTTARAEELLQGAGLTSKRRKARRDMVAAHAILSTYLEDPTASQNPGGLS